jgi:hypothetical protein
MSRLHRLLLLLSCLLALPVLAAHPPERAGSCPEAATPLPSRERPAPSAASEERRVLSRQEVRGGDAGEAEWPSRQRPRWQSFLPGMVR